MPLQRPGVRGQLPLLQPHARGPERLGDNPWVLWQPITQPTAYTCTRCQTEQHGERYLELTGSEPQIVPVLPRDPATVHRMTSRVGRQVLCPTCRWAKVPVAEKPKPRKTTLD